MLSRDVCAFSLNNEPELDSMFSYYKSLNDQEQRLIEFKDDDTSLLQKIIQLNLINNSRKKYRAAPVQLDILACRLANRTSREAAENGYTSHWNLEGETPYQRYASVGGVDHISENAFGQRTNKTYEINAESVKKLMREGHLSFMAERKPHDGHKLNIINKYHNFVGIGFYLTDKQFNYYEEFIDRYLTFENIPQEVLPKKGFTIRVIVPEGKYLYFVSVGMDNFPKPMSSAVLNRTGNYDDFGSRNILNIKPWELSMMRSNLKYDLNFNFSKSGLYYVQLFLSDKEMTHEGSYNTTGKIQASGLVIPVMQ